MAPKILIFPNYVDVKNGTENLKSLLLRLSRMNATNGTENLQEPTSFNATNGAESHKIKRALFSFHTVKLREDLSSTMKSLSQRETSSLFLNSKLPTMHSGLVRLIH